MAWDGRACSLGQDGKLWIRRYGTVAVPSFPALGRRLANNSFDNGGQPGNFFPTASQPLMGGLMGGREIDLDARTHGRTDREFFETQKYNSRQ